METRLGRFPAQTELPEPVKFAWPIMVLPELFTSARHLAPLVGYLATIGWEVFAPDLTADAGFAQADFAKLVDSANEALTALGREAVVVGHGIGGLVALKLAERAGVKAGIAIAPLAPGFPTPLLVNFGNRIRMWRGLPLNPPARRMLFEFVADADIHSRAQIIKALTPGATEAAMEVVAGNLSYASADHAAPRLIVAGESDIFAPFEKLEAFAQRIGAPIAKIPNRGHWLIGGRALERTINEIQRFLVRSLGQDLLLLFAEEWKQP